jgi:hypothetical protein
MSRSVLPHRRLLTLDERLEHAAARPVIVPEMIVCDHGKAFISRNFRASCRFLEIDFQPTHKGSPFEKGQIGHGLDAAGRTFPNDPLMVTAQARWRAVTGAHLVALVSAGATFENGVLVERPEAVAA